jgi:hypothetical protein
MGFPLHDHGYPIGKTGRNATGLNFGNGVP